MSWKTYRKIATQEARPYVPGEDLAGISVSPRDTPGPGGMIARNATDAKDQWYINPEFFAANYEEVTE